MINIFKRYWLAYGGFKALHTSPYLHMALMLTFLLWPHWAVEGAEWWQHPLQIMPSMLGFSLGGFAIWMALGSDAFRTLISGASERSPVSPYMSLCSAFVHFILVQMLSLIAALIADAYQIVSFGCLSEAEYYSEVMCVFRFFGYWLFMYALTTGIAATMQVFRTSSWYDSYVSKTNGEERKK